MGNYILRKGKFSHEIAKFEESSYPSDVYRISERKCDCPSRFSSCKHLKIFKTWKAENYPTGRVYDDHAQKVGELF